MNNATPQVISGKYGFYDRLKEAFPSQIIVDSTELCNLACIHCPHPQFKQSKYYSGRKLDPELNAKLVDEVRNFGRGITQYIRYTSEGEPLIHPQIFDMLSLAVRESGTTVTLTTNGVLLTDSRIARLLACGVHLVDISIDAFNDETYAKVRVNGDLSVTRSNVLNLIAGVKENRSQMKVVVSYIEQPMNERETSDFELFWKDNGADHVVIRKLHSCAGAKSSIADQMRMDSVTEIRRPCLYPWERIVLTPRGSLAFCPADWTHGSTIADYSKVSIRETWQGEFYQKLREAHITNRYHNHLFCGQCPDWSATSWPGEGRSYANMVEEFKDLE